MGESRFKIVFERLADLEQSAATYGDTIAVSLSMRDEIDEIGELRRLVQESTEVDRKSYTTT